MQFCAWQSVMTPVNKGHGSENFIHRQIVISSKAKLTSTPPRNHAHGAVHRRDDLAAHLAELRVRQPPHAVHQGVELLDDGRHGRHVRRHLLRPLLAVFVALVQVLAVGAVAGDDVERFAEHKVLEGGGVHWGYFFLATLTCFFLWIVNVPLFSLPNSSVDFLVVEERFGAVEGLLVEVDSPFFF